MNRKNSMILLTVLALLLCMLIGCGGAGADTDAPVAGVTDTEQNHGPTDEQLAAIAEVYGLSEEELAAMPAEELEMLMLELGYIDEPANVGNVGENGNSGTDKKKTTLSDVSAGGSYVVTIGDSMLWNYMEFYYVDGKLQKIVAYFSKDGSEEDLEIMTFEGAEATGCTMFDIDYSGSPESVAHQLNEIMGYSSVYIEPMK